MRIEVSTFRLPLVRPLRTARGEVSEREVHLLILTDDDGVKGCGEAAPLPGFGGGDPAQVAQQLASWKTCDDALRRWWHGETLPEGLPAFADGAEPAACHALDEALCDLAAQRAGQPLWHWLNPHATGDVATYRLARNETHAAELFAAGTAAVKLKVAHRPLVVERAALTELAAQMKPTQRLRLDANGGWSAAEAVEFVRSAAALPVDVLEQPVAGDEWAELRQVRNAAPAAWTVSVDEGVPHVMTEGFALLSPGEDSSPAPNPDGLTGWGMVVKPMFLGGLRPAWRFATTAMAHGMRVTVTTALDGVVGRAGAWHLAAAVSQPHERHGLRTGSLLKDDLPFVFPLAPAAHPDAARLSTAPGLGLVPA